MRWCRSTPTARCAHLASGSELRYDALLVATGAYVDPVYPHATPFDPERIDELLHGLVQDIEEGYLHRLAVVIPAPPPWPLPAYELALMASERAWDMQQSLDVTLITPERCPIGGVRDDRYPRAVGTARRAPDRGDHLGVV